MSSERRERFKIEQETALELKKAEAAKQKEIALAQERARIEIERQKRAEIEVRVQEEKRKHEEEIRSREAAQRPLTATNDEIAHEWNDIRNFALRECVEAWDSLGELRADLKILDGKVSELKRSCRRNGRNPESDPEFNRIRELINEMKGAAVNLETSISEAYLESLRFEATPLTARISEKWDSKIKASLTDSALARQRYMELRQRER